MAVLRCCLYLQVVMLPYPLAEPFRGVTQVQAGKGTFLEKRIFPVPDGKGGMPNDAAGNAGPADAHRHSGLRNDQHHVEGTAVHREQA